MEVVAIDYPGMEKLYDKFIVLVLIFYQSFNDNNSLNNVFVWSSEI